MTEYDSGSGSDSGSSSSSDSWSSSDSSSPSSDSSSGHGGFDNSLVVQSLVENTLDSIPTGQRSAAVLPVEQRSAEFEAAIKALFVGSGPVQDERSLLRRIVEAERWFVPSDNQKLNPTAPGWGDPTVYLYTHPDRGEAKHAPMIELDGLTPYKQLAARGEYVRIGVNPMRPVGLVDQLSIGLSLAPRSCTNRTTGHRAAGSSRSGSACARPSWPAGRTSC